MLFSVLLGASTEAQESAFPTAASQPKFTQPSSNSFSFQETKARAEKGDAEAQFNLGADYWYGDGVPQDYAEAVKWSRKAAEQNYAPAQFNLAVLYEHGDGIPQDLTEAAKWYRKAAEQGYASAQNNLGLAYFMGQRVPQDYGEAAKWYRKAAEQGLADAEYNLGFSYFKGQGVTQDYGEAAKWFRMAADQGYAMAESFLGLFYYSGLGFPQDYAEGAKWYRKAAEQGEAKAQGLLGFCYDTGKGVAQDYAEAVKWYRKAAEQGDAMGQFSLGISYETGRSVPQDYVEAVKWLRRSAQQGEAIAQCQLGRLYSLGRGVPQDYVEAFKWFNLAAAQNDADGIHLRDSLSATDSITPAQIAEGQRLSREFVARKEGGASNRGDGQEAVVGGNLPRATGTGFFVTEDGYLLTCFHVVLDAARITVRTKAGTLAAKLVKADKANDLALLKVAGKFLPLPIGLSRGMKLGESVFTIGFPNIELQGFAPKLTKGEISSLTGMQDDPREFQISVAVQPGNSGGPLVNQYGNVVGIVAAQLADIATLETTGSLPQNVNYAVKSSVLNVLLESLPEISAKLPAPNPTKDRKFEDVEKDAEEAVALVLVY